MQRLQRSAYQDPRIDDLRGRLRVMEQLVLADRREHVARKRWLLVVNPVNYEVCMRMRVWGRQHEHEAHRYAAGDLCFFHVTGRSEVLAMGMFTGSPYGDEAPLWPRSAAGVFPWRVRFVPLGELQRVGISTRDVLQPLHRGAPRNWFHGFIQQSHELRPEHASALRIAFERALRTQHSMPA
jgi:hypothetical protein